jgi:hypothetical protein
MKNKDSVTSCREVFASAFSAIFTRNRILRCMLIIAGALVVTARVDAQIALNGFWRFDNDPNAANGRTLDDPAVGGYTGTDATGNGYSLFANGGGTMAWSNDRAPVDNLRFGGGTNTLSMQYLGTSTGFFGLYRNTVNTAVDNVAYDLWLKPTNDSGTKYILSHGYNETAGFALVQNGPNLQLHMNGSAVITTSLNINAWQQVAVVRDSGVTTLYINGSSVGTSSATPGADASTYLDLGMAQGAGGSQAYFGFIDELRFLTWSGTDNLALTDLNYVSAIPEPSTYAALAGAAMLGLAIWRRRTRNALQRLVASSSVQRALCIGALLAITTTWVTAQIVPSSVRYWTMGDSDSGAAAGNATNSTMPAHAGGLTLTKDSGASITYSSDVFSSTSLGHANNLSMSFAGTGATPGYFANSVASSATDNFFLEAWVKPSGTSTANGAIAFNGSAGSSNGYGLFQSGSNYEVRLGDSGVMVAPLTAGTWTHVALVRNNGTTSLYINGTEANSGSAAPTTPTTYFRIGESDISNYGFSGLIDEVRFAEFSAGSFSTSMLNISAIPEPSTYAAIAGAAMLALAVWRRQRLSAANASTPLT